MQYKVAPDEVAPVVPFPRKAIKDEQRIAALEQEVLQLRRDLAAANMSRPSSTTEGARDGTIVTNNSAPSTPIISNAMSSTSIPLVGDLEILLMFFFEVMKPRPLATTLPACDKTERITKTDCINLAKGFDFLSKTSGSDEDAIGTYLNKVRNRNA